MTDEPRKCREHLEVAVEANPFENEVLRGQIARIHLDSLSTLEDD